MLGIKNKNFAEIAAAEHPEIYQCPSQRPRSDFTESEYSYSTQATYHTGIPSSATILRIVKSFFDKYSSKLSSSEQSNLITRVTNLFTGSAFAFQDCDNNKNLQEIVQNFQKLIPLSILTNIAYSDIASLFQSISIAFQNDDVTNPFEILRCVLEETFDSLQGQTRSSAQEFIIQSLKDMIMSMPLGQLMGTTVMSQVSSNISQMIGDKMSGLTSIDKTEVVDSLIDFAEENLIGGNRDELETALHGILDDIVKKIEK